MTEPPETPDIEISTEIPEGEAPTQPLPTPTSLAAMPEVDARGARRGYYASQPIKPWRPAWWNRTPGPVVYEYDWFDWLIRVLFFTVGLLLGFLIWHGLHFSFSL